MFNVFSTIYTYISQVVSLPLRFYSQYVAVHVFPMCATYPAHLRILDLTYLLNSAQYEFSRWAIRSDRSVGKVTRLPADWRRFSGSIPECGTHTAAYSICSQVAFYGAKWPER